MNLNELKELKEPKWCRLPYLRVVQIQWNGIDHTTVRIHPQGREIAIYEEQRFIGSWLSETIYMSGDDSPENSLLVKLKTDDQTRGLYLFINDEIYTFSLPSDVFISRFYSPIHMNNIPLPWIVTAKHLSQTCADKTLNVEDLRTILLTEAISIPTNPKDILFTTSTTPYDRFRLVYKPHQLFQPLSDVCIIRKAMGWKYYQGSDEPDE